MYLAHHPAFWSTPDGCDTVATFEAKPDEAQIAAALAQYVTEENARRFEPAAQAS